METDKKHPQFLLLGDSLIQYSSYFSNGGYHFGAALAEQCIRRLDLVNKGYSGYNTSQILKILDHLVPAPTCARVSYLLILLGANDSNVPTMPTGQHVPLDKYQENIRRIITHPCVVCHNPTIILVSPPPIHEAHLEVEDLKKGYSAATRRQSVTAKYAEAIREIAAEFRERKVLLVDLWTAMIREGARLTPGFVEGGEVLLGSKESGDSLGLRSLLVDGLHLTAAGYALFFKELMNVLAATKGNIDEQPWVFPQWSTAPAME